LVANERARRDVVVIGSLSLVRAGRGSLVDEYRLITFPIVVGEGNRLFATGTPVDLRFTVVEPADAAAQTVLSVLRRDRGQEAQ
jgi:dihydrofolate reductase